jgi:hypothetical protein
LGVGILSKWAKMEIGVLVLSFVSVLAYHFYMNAYVPYVPITYREWRGFMESPKLNTKEHQENIKLVLKGHDIKWKIEHGKVMIQRKLKVGFNNREWLYNLTLKANDNKYMKKLKQTYKRFNR